MSNARALSQSAGAEVPDSGREGLSDAWNIGFSGVGRRERRAKKTASRMIFLGRYPEGAVEGTELRRVLRAGDRDDDLIEMPLVSGPRQAPADLVGEGLAELERPLPHGLVADDD